MKNLGKLHIIQNDCSRSSRSFPSHRSSSGIPAGRALKVNDQCRIKLGMASRHPFNSFNTIRISKLLITRVVALLNLNIAQLMYCTPRFQTFSRSSLRPSWELSSASSKGICQELSSNGHGLGRAKVFRNKLI